MILTLSDMSLVWPIRTLQLSERPNGREEEAGQRQFCIQKEEKSFLKPERRHVTTLAAARCQVT